MATLERSTPSLQRQAAACWNWTSGQAWTRQLCVAALRPMPRKSTAWRPAQQTAAGWRQQMMQGRFKSSAWHRQLGRRRQQQGRNRPQAAQRQAVQQQQRAAFPVRRGQQRTRRSGGGTATLRRRRRSARTAPGSFCPAGWTAQSSNGTSLDCGRCRAGTWVEKQPPAEVRPV